LQPFSQGYTSSLFFIEGQTSDKAFSRDRISKKPNNILWGHTWIIFYLGTDLPKRFCWDIPWIYYFLRDTLAALFYTGDILWTQPFYGDRLQIPWFLRDTLAAFFVFRDRPWT